jgi:excisionase family DNA binding protein
MDSNPGSSLPAVRGLRIKEAAVYLGCTPWFIEIVVRTKKIPAYKMGRHYVLFKEDLDNYVESLRRQKTEVERSEEAA